MQGGTLYGTPGEISTPPLPKPRFVLTDTAGSPFDFWQKARGYVTLLFFGYTYCPDQCPLHMANLGMALKKNARRHCGSGQARYRQLARRLTAQPGNQKVGVLNEGIAGNRLLHDSLGPNGLARFDRDALTQTGVTYVIVQTGGNDIGVGWSGGPSPADEVTAVQIIQGHKQLIKPGHARGLKIYGATLTPVEGFLIPGTPCPVFSPSNEVKRQAVNGGSAPAENRRCDRL